MGSMIKAAIKVVLLLALGPGLQACASVATGVEQTVAVSTAPPQPASCTLQNERGQWTVARTPGSASVAKAYGPLSVRCKTDAGQVGLASVPSTTAGAVFGNMIAGGLIGAAIDIGSGAAYQYPPSIVVAIAAALPPTSPPTSPPAAAPPVPVAQAPAAQAPASQAPVSQVPAAQVPAAQVPAAQVPARVFCRRQGRVQEYRDEDWCVKTGGTVVASPAADAMAAAPPAAAPLPADPPNRLPVAPLVGTAAPAVSGTCYLPDGRQMPLARDACAAQQGFIGA